MLADQRYLHTLAAMHQNALYGCGHDSDFANSEEDPEIFLSELCPHCEFSARFGSVGSVGSVSSLDPMEGSPSIASDVSTSRPGLSVRPSDDPDGEGLDDPSICREIVIDDADAFGWEADFQKEAEYRIYPEMEYEEPTATHVEHLSSSLDKELPSKQDAGVTLEAPGSNIALQKYNEAIPNGRAIAITPGTGLLCGFAAVIISMELCFPDMHRPRVSNLEETFNSPKFQEATKDFGLTNTNYFHLNQIGAALYHFSAPFGLNLQVGCVREVEAPLLVPHPNDEPTTVVWIHHAPSHFSGLRPKKTDSFREINGLGSSVDMHVEADGVKTDELRPIEIDQAQSDGGWLKVDQDESSASKSPISLGLRGGGGGDMLRKASDLSNEEWDAHDQKEDTDEDENNERQ